MQIFCEACGHPFPTQNSDSAEPTRATRAIKAYSRVLERFGALVLLMWVGIVVAGVMYGFAIFNLAGGSESNAQISSPGVTADIKLGELFPL